MNQKQNIIKYIESSSLTEHEKAELLAKLQKENIDKNQVLLAFLNILKIGHEILKIFDNNIFN